MLLAACAGCQAAPEVDVQVGALSDDAVRVAFTIADGNIAAYVCGRGDTLATHTRWYSGPVSGSSFELTAAGWTLSGTRNADSATGTLREPNGTQSTWSTRVTSKREPDGLYHVMDSGCRTGVIVDRDAQSALTFQGAWCDAQGNVAQVNPLPPPASIERTGFDVLVAGAASARTLHVTPVDPAALNSARAR